MKLSELVRFRNHLESVYNTDRIAHETDLSHYNLLAVRNETDNEDFKQQISNLAENLRAIDPLLDHNRSLYKSVVANLNRQIADVSAKFFSGNYDLELRVEEEAVATIRRIRVLEVTDPSLAEELKARIALHSNWRYPALEIGCRDGEWTQYLTASDPLYITDQYRDFIDSTMEQFPPEYQSRLRHYLLRTADLSVLPQNQFSFIFCWNFLNYRSLDTIKEYLKQARELLRPGGVFLFSYNNGDIAQSAGYAENFWMTYVPKSMLIPMCESLGFRVTYSRDCNTSGTAISWIEIQKPGSLATVKAHQVLGELTRITR
jgi:SAM-dependent methyltransferase